ncbi:hypothetical protein [Mangrovibacterium diazotrophicum]|uniref:Outer membrane protein with beta-barrel domain n=1 Tax=Mangrovibacterium diazotrophicum TaxID=1261403 RepID=A0A419VX75_9BACT|nr:hypothetical protein [Mangrovibacterium diazotrophicum]RKD87818.1 hypothetical protein BC643_3825 [Mangrovibacterium diazotrophicum]
MKKKISCLVVFLAFGISLFAQNNETDFFDSEPLGTPEPFLYSTSALTPDDLPWSVNYSGSYGNSVSGAFGYDGVGQQLAVKGYLGAKFTLYANAALGIPSDGSDVSSSQQVEVIRNFIGGRSSQGLRFGLGLGANRDFTDVYSLLSRITGAFDTNRWKLGGNLLLEKSFSGDRDKVDVITSIGVHYRLTGNFFAGIEGIGEDLEGLWEEDEAEGGAKVMLGPSLNLAPNRSRFSFSMSGGPVMYVTRSSVTNPAAIRELPSENGLTLRARIIYSISGT